MTETTEQRESVDAIAARVVQTWHDLPGSPEVIFTGRELRTAVAAALQAERDAHSCGEWPCLADIVARMDQALATVTAERDAALAEVAKLRHTPLALLGEFERATQEQDRINAGQRGMSVPFHGDFAGAIQHPGLMGRIRWWARELQDALATPPQEPTP
jgi:hypothetical protein